MPTHADRDFSSILDALFAEHGEPADEAPLPNIPYDYLSVAEELHSGRIRVSADRLAADYRDAQHAYEDELEEALNAAKLLVGIAAAQPEPLPSIEPEDIAVELGLDGAPAHDIARIRRAFAFANHPDRVAPHLRQRAMVRMQVANMLIDDARKRAAGKR